MPPGSISAADDALLELEEAQDQFPAPSSDGAVFQIGNLDMIRNSTPRAPSIHASEVASTVGSTVMEGRDAFLKSITFWKSSSGDGPQQTSWAIKFLDPNSPDNNNGEDESAAHSILALNRKYTKPKDWLKKKVLGIDPSKSRLYVDSVGGVVTYSRIQFGDYLKLINGTSVKDLADSAQNDTENGALTSTAATEYMETCLERDGYLSIVTENKEMGDDILIQATIIKPKPNMKFKDMGMEVWWWGYLCVRGIEEGSIFEPTVLRETDHIVAVNDISCREMRPDAFATAIDRLDSDITITVLRRKQRWGGKFS